MGRMTERRRETKQRSTKRSHGSAWHSEALEPRLLLSADSASEYNWIPNIDPGSGDLVQVLKYDRLVPAAVAGKMSQRVWNAVVDVVNCPTSAAARTPARPDRCGVCISEAGEIEVYIHTSVSAETQAQQLQTLGIEVVTYSQSLNVIQAWLPASRAVDVGQMPEVVYIDLPDYAVPRTGWVNSEGDAALDANDVRDRFFAYGVDGSGVSVGVISTGVLNRAYAEATGDLPTGSVGIIIDSARPGIADDEGTAMLEIIHDLAPGAQLYFSGPRTSLEMTQSIAWLVSQGVDVIVDDLGFNNEPFFADGPVAQAAANAVGAGVTYVSAAGNDAYAHYQSQFVQGPWSGNGYWHSFATGDHTLGFEIQPGATFVADFQWSDPFGASINNYGLYLYRSDFTYLTHADVTQPGGSANPREQLVFQNAGGTVLQVILGIHQPLGAAARELELFTYNASSQEYRTMGDSVFGHPAAEGVIAVGAVNSIDPGWDTVAYYSSQGPSTIYTDFASQTRVSRTSLDGVAIDGVNTYVGLFGFWSNPFYGTSAAAPHVAALAALVLDAKPSATPALVQSILTSTATDLAAYGTGYDAVSGYGLFNGLNAAYKAFTASVPDLTVVSDTGISDADNVTMDTTPTFTGQAPTGSYVRLYVDDVERGAQQLSAGAWQYNITTGVLSNGAHSVTIRVAAAANTPLTNLSYPSPSLAITIDTVPPVVMISKSFSSPISGPVPVGSTVTYAFSEAVLNFDLSDLALRHQNVVAIPMVPGSQALSSGDGGVTWVLSGLNSVSTWAGEYYLWLLRAGFSDRAGNLLASDVAATWFQNTISGDIGGVQNDTIRLVRDSASPRKFNVFINNTTATPNYYVQSPSASYELKVNGLAGNDAITIDLTNGVNSDNPITCQDGGGSDSLTVIGTTGADAISLGTGSVNFGTRAISWSAIESVTVNGGAGDDVLTQTAQPSTSFAFNGGSGSDTLNVNAGTFTFNSDASPGSANLTINVNSSAAVVFNATQHLSALNINDTATATLSAGGNRVLVVNSLSLGSTGRLNLTDNDLIIRSNAANRQSVYNAVWAKIASGRNAAGGTWQGYGITSSSAQSSSYTSLGVMLNNSFSVFSGESVDSNCILVKYTWYGDADLSGFITGDDYYRTDMGYFGGLSGWSNGDYDYNGVIDGSDYFLLDLGYLGQTGTL